MHIEPTMFGKMGDRSLRFFAAKGKGHATRAAILAALPAKLAASFGLRFA